MVYGVCAELDITERKRAEEEIKNLAKFPSENPNPVMRIDQQGILLYANQAAFDVLTCWDIRIGQACTSISCAIWFKPRYNIALCRPKCLVPHVYFRRVPLIPLKAITSTSTRATSPSACVRKQKRERLAAQVREQARQMAQILATVPAAVLLLDAASRVLQANPVAEDDLALLAGAKVGDILTHLGDRPIAELLTSPTTKGLWHEVTADNRTFEVIARPIANGPEPEYLGHGDQRSDADARDSHATPAAGTSGGCGTTRGRYRS